MLNRGKPDSLSQMAVNPRNLLLFGALGVLALVTWVIARIAEEPAVQRVDSGPSSQGYYLTGAVMHVTDDEGKIYYRIVADRVTQESEEQEIVLDGMRLEYTPDTNVRWRVYAGTGRAHADRDFLNLAEDVRVVYVADDSAEEIVFETDEMSLDADKFLAYSERDVTLHKGNSEMTAAAFELNMQTDTYTLIDGKIRRQR